MRLFSYCIPVDDGAAPNPFWGVCTLVICKPVIRRVADQGDWIVGVGSTNVSGKNYSGKMVYAMKVTYKMSLRKYDSHCLQILRNKIPDINHQDYSRRVGDCIYDYRGGFEPVMRQGVHDAANMAKDLRGENALLSEQFYYFGDCAEPIPPEFSILIRQGQGHQSTRNQSIKTQFVDWLESNFEKNKLYGNPQVKVDFIESDKKKICASVRCSEAEEDELADYSEENLPLSHWSYFLALEADLKSISRYIELHEGNYPTFSIGLTQLFLAACSEIDVVLETISILSTGKEAYNMGDYSKSILSKIPSIVNRRVTIPIYNLSFSPFKEWTAKQPPAWWDSYNKVKHHRNTNYKEANLGNTLKALGALYILIFELFRVHKGKEEGGFSANLIYKHLQPRQELFLLEDEGRWRDIAEGKKSIFGR